MLTLDFTEDEMYLKDHVDYRMCGAADTRHLTEVDCLLRLALEF